MPASDPKYRALLLGVLIAVIAILGLIAISLMFYVWRRVQRRLRVTRRKRRMADLWQAGGDRLVSKLNRDEFAQREARGELKSPDDHTGDEDEDPDPYHLGLREDYHDPDMPDDDEHDAEPDGPANTDEDSWDEDDRIDRDENPEEDDTDDHKSHGR